jgi:predicted nucleotidyltransferase
VKIKNPEQFTEAIQERCGDNLRSVILFGSAAAGDYATHGSDYNLLIVLNDLSPAALRALSRPVSAWERAGNPPPLLFTPEQLTQAVDVFPVEMMDLRDAHRILAGEDPVAGLQPSMDHLRLQVERELRVALLRLRRGYLTVSERPGRLAALLVGSLSSVLAVFRAALRLYGQPVPMDKWAALDQLRTKVALNSDCLQRIRALKTGEQRLKTIDAGPLFEEYVKAIEAVVDAVDRL